MLVSRCKTSFSAEITLQEPSQRQHTVTIFPKTLETFYQKKGKVLNVDHLEDEMLEFQSLDFTVNRRKVVIKIEEHVDQECKGTGSGEVNNKTNNNIDQDLKEVQSRTMWMTNTTIWRMARKALILEMISAKVIKQDQQICSGDYREK